jgi:hypothetical protein
MFLLWTYIGFCFSLPEPSCSLISTPARIGSFPFSSERHMCEAESRRQPTRVCFQWRQAA